MSEPVHYQNVHTPKPTVANDGYAINADYSTSAPPRSTSVKALWFAVHLIVGLGIALAIFAPLGYNLPLYPLWFSTPFSRWWGVDPKVKGSGRPEMVLPTYFFLIMVLPVVIGAILFTWSRTKAPAGSWSPLSPFLHRKPSLFAYKVSYGEILFVAIIIVGNILVLYYQFDKRQKPNNNTNQTIKVIGTSSAFNALFNFVFLALPASRHSFWMEWLNIPFPRAVKYHRWLAVATILTVLLHSSVYFTYYIRIDSLKSITPCFDCDLAKEGLTRWEYFFGILAASLMMLMGLLSLPVVRRTNYKLFLTGHLLFIPVTLFVVLHYHINMYFLYTVIVLYLVNRLYSTASISTPVSIKRARTLPDHVIELTFECSTSYNPGDAVWLKVPALSNTKWHPFSVASTPVLTPGLLTVYVKALGPWTSGLYQYIDHCNAKNLQPVVYLDGGYTPATPLSNEHGSAVFVGGGIGITPIIGQLTHFLLTASDKTVWLVWHARQPSMLHQFQGWLRTIETIASSTGNRLHIRLHVTQEQTTQHTFDQASLVPHLDEVHAKSYEARPYAHLNTMRRLFVLLASFAFSGALLTTVRYRNVIQTPYPHLWWLQRVVEFVLVIVGAYLGYVVIYINKATPAPHHTAAIVDDRDKDVDVSTFLSQHKVEYKRADWLKLFAEVENQSTSDETIGVFVCGPKSMVQAVDSAVQSKSKYHVHNEEFEL